MFGRHSRVLYVLSLIYILWWRPTKRTFPIAKYLVSISYLFIIYCKFFSIFMKTIFLRPSAQFDSINLMYSFVHFQLTSIFFLSKDSMYIVQCIVPRNHMNRLKRFGELFRFCYCITNSSKTTQFQVFKIRSGETGPSP